MTTQQQIAEIRQQAEKDCKKLEQKNLEAGFKNRFEVLNTLYEIMGRPAIEMPDTITKEEDDKLFAEFNDSKTAIKDYFDAHAEDRDAYTEAVSKHTAGIAKMNRSYQAKWRKIQRAAEVEIYYLENPEWRGKPVRMRWS